MHMTQAHAVQESDRYPEASSPFGVAPLPAAICRALSLSGAEGSRVPAAEALAGVEDQHWSSKHSAAASHTALSRL